MSRPSSALPAFLLAMYDQLSSETQLSVCETYLEHRKALFRQDDFMVDLMIEKRLSRWGFKFDEGEGFCEPKEIEAGSIVTIPGRGRTVIYDSRHGELVVGQCVKLRGKEYRIREIEQAYKLPAVRLFIAEIDSNPVVGERVKWKLAIDSALHEIRKRR